MTRRPAIIAAVEIAAGVAGIGVSVYLTVVHYSAVPLVCSTTGAVDCERVLASGYAVIDGTSIPTSTAGIAWFAVSTVLAAAQLAGRSSPWLMATQMAWSSIGLATVLGLVFIEIVLLGAICIWCSSAHLLVLVTFLASLSASISYRETTTY